MSRGNEHSFQQELPPFNSGNDSTDANDNTQSNSDRSNHGVVPAHLWKCWERNLNCWKKIWWRVFFMVSVPILCVSGFMYCTITDDHDHDHHVLVPWYTYFGRSLIGSVLGFSFQVLAPFYMTKYIPNCGLFLLYLCIIECFDLPFRIPWYLYRHSMRKQDTKILLCAWAIVNDLVSLCLIPFLISIQCMCSWNCKKTYIVDNCKTVWIGNKMVTFAYILGVIWFTATDGISYYTHSYKGSAFSKLAMVAVIYFILFGWKQIKTKIKDFLCPEGNEHLSTRALTAANPLLQNNVARAQTSDFIYICLIVLLQLLFIEFAAIIQLLTYLTRHLDPWIANIIIYISYYLFYLSVSVTTLELVGKIVHRPEACASPALKDMPFYEFKYAFMFLYDLFTMLFITFNASIDSITFYLLTSLRILFKWWPWYPVVWDYICVRCVCCNCPCCTIKCAFISEWMKTQCTKYRLAIEYRYQFIILLSVSVLVLLLFG